MNSFTFRPAVRENVGLLIGLAGGTGSGKTKSAMRLASGIAGDKPFAVIDTEARRALHYASEHRFDHGELRAPFSPDAYAQAIKAADEAGYPVIVVDSASHEHAGDGGLLDMHEAELARMAGDNWQKREACKMAAWIKPKTQHKAMVNKLLQVRAHLILCFRAEEKIEMQRIDGKMQMVPKKARTGKDGWVPICEKNLPFEMTCSFLLTSDRPGIPQPIKLEAQHRHLFPEGKEIDEAGGRALAAWAAGGKAPTSDGKKPAQNIPENIPETSGDAYDKAVKARAELIARAEVVAKGGFKELKDWWQRGISATERDAIASEKDRLTTAAYEADRAATTI